MSTTRGTPQSCMILFTASRARAIIVYLPHPSSEPIKCSPALSPTGAYELDAASRVPSRYPIKRASQHLPLPRYIDDDPPQSSNGSMLTEKILCGRWSAMTSSIKQAVCPLLVRTRWCCQQGCEDIEARLSFIQGPHHLTSAWSSVFSASRYVGSRPLCAYLAIPLPYPPS